MSGLSCWDEWRKQLGRMEDHRPRWNAAGMVGKLHDSERLGLAMSQRPLGSAGHSSGTDRPQALVNRNCCNDLERVEAEINGRRGRLLQVGEKLLENGCNGRHHVDGEHFPSFCRKRMSYDEAGGQKWLVISREFFETARASRGQLL